MGLSADQRTVLAKEGLATIGDFQDFQRDELILAFNNSRNLDLTLPVSVISTKCLLVASTVWHYYLDTGHAVTLQILHLKMCLATSI